MFSMLFIYFAEHPWIQQQQIQGRNSHHQTVLSFGVEDMGSCSFSSFSNPIVRRSNDFSFGFTPPDSETRVSSSSSPLQADTAAAAGFSFPLLPSFSFFSPLDSQEHILNLSSTNATKGNIIQRDSSFGELLDEEAKGPAAPPRAAIGLRSKRNHTIGVGEIEQLDLMVSESVIRWASCTHLPGTTSLRSSLVC